MCFVEVLPRLKRRLLWCFVISVARLADDWKRLLTFWYAVAGLFLQLEDLGRSGQRRAFGWPRAATRRPSLLALQNKGSL